MVSLTGMILLCLVTSFALLTVTPLGHDIGLGLGLQNAPGGSLIKNQASQLNMIAQATATAVFHQTTDGYSGSGGVTVSSGSGSESWPFGQCTAWANYRYHALTGHWVNWTGNAWQWASGAGAAGWHVSNSPHIPSIVVLMPYVEGASAYGHVAVAESMVNSTTVRTSNWNWWAAGGGWGVESFWNFTTGSGVYFVWK
jgi:surface antigen